MADIVSLTNKFADILGKYVKAYYVKSVRDHNKREPDRQLPDDFHKKDWEIKVRPGKKYIKIDVGYSGKFMVDTTDGGLYFIKGYGVIDKRKYFGKVENLVKQPGKWWYDGYSIAQKGKSSGGYGWGGAITETTLRLAIQQELKEGWDQESTVNEFIYKLELLVDKFKKLDMKKAEKWANRFWRSADGWNKDLPRTIQLLSSIEKKGK